MAKETSTKSDREQAEKAGQRFPRPLGPFTLVRLIAQGGMGQVFLALRPVPGETTDEVCVVKTVRTDLKSDREAVGRFLDEARVVQKLHHPNICHTLDAGFVDDTYYLALEFISGRNLRDVQNRAQKLGRAMPPALGFYSVIAVLEALAHAHALVDPSTNKAMNVVHRDVSPHNVMLGFDGGIKLIDFGLAAHGLKQELTRPGIMVGKLRYNAPEQVREKALDGRSDLYSVGVMLYEMFTGERFYEGLAEDEIWRVAMAGTHRPRAYKTLPGDMKNILDIALAGDPRDRFPSAADMRDAVAEVAQARGWSCDRVQASRFMAELFGEERRAEREMIVYATGLAEAHTRLIDQPASADLMSAPPKTTPGRKSAKGVAARDVDDDSGGFRDAGPDDARKASGAELEEILGRTLLLSPADVRSRLDEILSEIDPDAETMLPSDPVAALAALSPPKPTAPTSSSPKPTSKPARKAPAQTSAADQFANARTDSGLVDHNEKQAPPAAPQEPRADVQALGTRAASGAFARPAHPFTTPQIAIAAAVVVVALIAIVLATRSRPAAPDAPDAALDVPVAVETKAPDVPAAPPVVDASEPVVLTPVASNTVPDAPPQTQPVAPTDATAPTPATTTDSDGEEEAMPSGTPRKPRAGGARSHAPRGADAAPPASAPTATTTAPKKELRTLRDQLDFLQSSCTKKVACAKPVLATSARLVQLSPTETKALVADAAACAAKCQQ